MAADTALVNAPDQLFRRAIHAVMRLQQAIDDAAIERGRLEREREEELARAKRAAQDSAADALASLRILRSGLVPDLLSHNATAPFAWAPGSERWQRGSDFRKQFEVAATWLRVPWSPPRSTTSDADAAMLPAALADVVAEWRVLAGALDEQLVRYATHCREWSTRMFRRRATAPRVDQASWNSTFRLDLLRAHAERVAVAEVANRVREVAAAADLMLEAAQARARDARAVHTGEVNRSVADLERALDISGAAWTDARWQAARPADADRSWVRLGELRLTSDAAVPALVQFPLTASLAVGTDREHRDAGTSLTRAVLLRLFAAARPGSLHAKIIDPVGIGQSVADFRHLSDYDPRLVDLKTWTSERDIEIVLDELTAHIEVVISKYLRRQFQSIDDYNRHAGEVAEPYRVLTVFDYPNGFTERTARQLLSLVENGPRCGVYAVLHHSTAVDADNERRVPPERLTQSMQRIVLTEPSASLTLAEPVGRVPLRFIPDAAPPIEFDADGTACTPYAQLLVTVGEAARAANERPQTVTLHSVLPLLARARGGAMPDLDEGRRPILDEPGSWWSASSAGSVIAPLGRSGAQEVTSMRFSSTDIASGGIMVGASSSGKTTAQHAMILTLSMLYSPEELELYLIDAKHGIEFQAYEDLPHARMVSVHSEREFSLSVLKSLVDEMADRAATMKAHGPDISNITEYRRRTGNRMSRIVVIIDEFHTLFQEPDRVGQEAFAAFSAIVRQGRAFGVHILVATQTLSDMPAMDRQTLLLLPQRVTFQCNESDAELLLRDGHRATRSLSRPGEGIFNPSSGQEASNQPFQGLFVESETLRPTILRAVRERANREGWTRRPRVFDGDRSAARPARAAASMPAGRLAIPLGEPFSLDAVLDVSLRRSRGENLLVVGDSAEQSSGDLVLRGVLHSALTSARAAGVSATVFDFAGEQLTDGAVTLERLAATTSTPYECARAVYEGLEAIATNVELRHAEHDYGAAPRLVVVYGLERASALSPFDPELLDELDEDERLVAGALLARILRDGPEVGIHTVLSADGRRTLERRLGRDLIDEFNHRVAGQLTDDRDMPLVTGHHGAVDRIRAGQLLLVDQVKGSEIRARGYDVIRADAADNGSTEEEDRNGPR